MIVGHRTNKLTPFGVQPEKETKSAELFKLRLVYGPSLVTYRSISLVDLHLNQTCAVGSG